MHRQFSYKKVDRIGFLDYAPKIAVDKLIMHTLVQMVIHKINDYALKQSQIFIEKYYILIIFITILKF